MEPDLRMRRIASPGIIQRRQIHLKGPVVFAQVTDDFNAEALNNTIANSEAQFVYCDISGENITSVLSDICEETWENGRVYQIRADGTLGYIDL